MDHVDDLQPKNHSKGFIYDLKKWFFKSDVREKQIARTVLFFFSVCSIIVAILFIAASLFL